MKHGAHLLYSFVLFVLDFVGLAVAFSLAYFIRVKLDDRPLLEPITAQGYMAVIAVLLVFWLVIYALLGLYRARVFENRFKEALLLLIGSFIGILFLIGSEYVLNRAIFPARLVTVYGFALAFFLTLLMRTIARGVRRRLFARGIGVTNVLLVGATRITTEMINQLRDPRLGYVIIGIVGDQRSAVMKTDTHTHYPSFHEAVHGIAKQDLHSIIQTELYPDATRNDEILEYAQQNHIAYRFVPGNGQLFTGNIDVDLFEGIPTISVHQTALVGWGRIAKRIFDVVGSLLAIILLSPLFVVLYALLKIVDSGPAIYTQERRTRFDDVVHIYKFRSFKMSVNNLPVDEALEVVGQTKLAHAYRQGDDSVPVDTLLHPLGKFLRMTSLDEIPQLFNVLQGSLSLVGPRPLVPREMDTFNQKNIILSVKPGATGLAVISGRRDISFEERRKLDLYYVQNWSFFMDIVIILKTVVVVMKRAVSKGSVD